MPTYSKYPRLGFESGVVDIYKPYFHIERYGALPTVSAAHDSHPAIMRAIDAAVAAQTGKILYGQGAYFLSTDVVCPRYIDNEGVGGNGTILYGTSQRRFQLTGVPGGTAQSVGDTNHLSNIGFNMVSLDIAPNPADAGRGMIVQGCNFANCDRAVYYGYATFNTKMTNCNFRLNTTCIYFDFATVGGNAGASMEFDGVVCSESTDGFYMNGATLDGYTIFLVNCEGDNSQRFFKTVNATGGDGAIHITNASMDQLSDCFIDNDAANIWIDGFSATTEAENYWFWNRRGNIFIERGRGSWAGNKFCRIDSGLIVVDTGRSFQSGPLWGDGASPFASASSTGGKVIAPRSGFLGRVGLAAPITLTNASPQNSTIRAGETWDGNDRVFEFDVHSLANGSDNFLRVQLVNGAATIILDFVFPVVVGGGRMRIVHRKGVSFSGSIVYAPSAAVGSAQSYYVTAADTSSAANASTLLLWSQKIGATASTITIDNLTETISGPKVIGL